MYKQGMGIRGLKISHIQGIATDKERKYMYFSCTDFLAKTDMDGNIIGTVGGLAGHLGCIAYNYQDGKVYGSLEFKHDAIGKPILDKIKKYTGEDKEILDGFYAVCFDVEKIDRIGMSAEADGIMKATFLKEVYDDYTAPNHRYGCSGIDGMTFAPIPGEKGGKEYLYVSYGIYDDVTRDDNDNQIILRYDLDEIKSCLNPLNQNNMHRIGPSAPKSKYFVHTGNTRYGIQNLEYVKEYDSLFATVYKGKKEEYPNYNMYFIDLSKKAEIKKPKGLDEEREVLTLTKGLGELDEKSNINGCNFVWGSTGMITLNDGYFYFSEDFKKEDGFGTEVKLYKFNKKSFDRV